MANDMDLLATTSSSGVASVVLSMGSASIANYRYIDIFGTAFMTNATGGIKMQFNGDGGNNYSSAYLEQQAAGTMGWGSGLNETSTWCAYRPSGSTDRPLHFYARIFNPNATDRNKQTQVRFGNYTEAFNGTYNGLWMNNNAITSITLVTSNGTNLLAGTNFQVYGIKG